MEIILIIFSALFGIATGSFLNVCIDRLPAGKSLVSPPSHCDACQRRLLPQDLIPVFSYLWLRGRCRYCQAHIPLRSLIIEIGSGVLFALIYGRYGLTIEFVVTAFYCSIFIVIMVIDWGHQLILNRVTYPSAVAAVIISIFLPPAGFVHFSLSSPVISAGVNGLVSSLIGGAIGFVFLLVPALINPRGMGWGDVKMAGLIGLVTGARLVLVALGMGIILGGLVAVVLLVLRIKKRKEVIPFGPFLSLGAIVALLYGGDILNWYLGLF